MSQEAELRRMLEAVKPEDVSLHIELLECYMKLKLIRHSYIYAIQAEKQYVFKDSLAWYNCLKKVFQLYECDEESVKNLEFYINYMRIMERIVHLLLRELPVIGKSMNDNTVEQLLSFGKVLQRSTELTVCDPVFHEVIQEMNSKFCIHLSAVRMAIQFQECGAPLVAYKKSTPKSLKESALPVVGTVIAKSVLDIFISVRHMLSEDFTDEKRRNLESLVIKASEFFDSIIPTSLHPIVTLHSLKCFPDDVWKFVNSCEIKLNYLDIIFRSQKHITGFTFYNNYVSSIKSVLLSSLHRLKKLEYLRLDIQYLKNDFDFLTNVTRAIKDMKNLASFVSDYCNDEIVKVVCNNNYALKKLILSEYMCDIDVTDSSVPYILNLKNLEELDIYYCYISTESQIQLLSGLPHLKDIAVHGFNKFLAQMNDDSVQLPYQSVRYNCESVNDIVNLTKYCPLITKLTLQTDSYTLEFCDITSLAALSHLKIFYCFIMLNYSTLKTFLELKGHDLIKLSADLIDISSVTETENEIKHLYPNLKEVTIYDGIDFN